MSDTILACQQLTKTYHDGNYQVPVLHNVDFTLSAGESVAIVGASGSGKSTLLHLLGGLDKPSEGKVLWGEHDVANLSEAKRCRLRNQQLGFIYQFHHLLPEFNALENVMMPLLLRGQPDEVATAAAQNILTKVGLEKRLTHKVSQLSGGERQRVAVARALVGKPKCVLADEPTGNLDQKTANDVLQVMLELQHDLAVSFVIVTHDDKLASRLQTCYSLTNGRLHKECE